MLAWNFGFRMWGLMRSPCVLFQMSAEYSAVMGGAFPGTWVTWQWLCLSMIYCCALRPWSRTGVIYQSCMFLDLVILSSCAGTECLGPLGWLHMCVMGYVVFRQPKFKSGCSEMLVFRVCGARQNFYVFSLYRNPDLDDRFYDCL